MFLLFLLQMIENNKSQTEEEKEEVEIRMICFYLVSYNLIKK